MTLLFNKKNISKKLECLSFT